jgi:hypothetical protein
MPSALHIEAPHNELNNRADYSKEYERNLVEDIEHNSSTNDIINMFINYTG